MRRLFSLLAAAGAFALGPIACGQTPMPTLEGRLAAVDVGDTFDPKGLGVPTAEELLRAAGYTPDEIARQDATTMQLLPASAARRSPRRSSRGTGSTGPRGGPRPRGGT